MTKAVQVHVGEGLDQMGRRFVEAWHRAERGEPVREAHVTFESWDTLVRTLSSSRLNLLRHIHRHPAAGTAALARSLGRSEESVREDLDALAAAGLINRRDDNLRADYDEIRTTIAL